jgi:hypothetical protein
MRATVPRRWVVLCAIGVAVLGLHAALLLVLGPAWFDPDIAPPLPLRSVQVRSVVWEPPRPAPAALVAEVLAPRKPMAAPTARVAPRDAPASQPVVVRPEAAPEPIAQVQASAPEVSLDIPVYATRLPPPDLWRYRMQRGLAVGVADLSWAPLADAGYELRLEGRVAGVTVLDWASRGQIDVAGLAPERFVLRRRGRDRHAANFQREAGKISFSGPTHEQPLPPGAQDRLSWILQLPAIVAAAPERFVSGAAIVLFVAGARGDADAWTFLVQGPESLDGTPALKLLREPRRLYDTRVEVWLDPAEHYLPLRVVQTPSGGGAALELQREPR